MKNLLFVTVIIALFCSGICHADDPLNNWQWRNPLPQGNALSSVIYDGNKFIAVGDSGTIMNSPDGATWAVQKPMTQNNLYSIVYANSTYISVGTNGTILISSNAINWSLIPVNSTAEFRGIAYGNGIFVIVGNKGEIFTSTDGSVWTYRTSGASWLSGITFGNGRFICSNTNISSTDGINWSAGQANSPTVNYVNNQFIGIGGAQTNYFRMSQDGINWNDGTNTPVSNYPLRTVTFGKNQYVVIYDIGNFWLSSDGNNWKSVSSGINAQFLSVTFGNGKYVAVGQQGNIITSKDGISWKSILPTNNSDFNAVRYLNGKYFAVGSNGTIKSSNDGISWATLPTDGTCNLNDITYGNGNYVAVGYTGAVATTYGCILHSTDNQNWTSGVINTVESIQSITFGNNKFLLAGQSSPYNYYGQRLSSIHFISSADAIIWTTNKIITDATYVDPSYHYNDYFISKVVYFNNKYIAIGTTRTQWTYPRGASIYVSSDLENWSTISYLSDNYEGKYRFLNDISCSNNMCAITGLTYIGPYGSEIPSTRSGLILTSSDFNTWTQKSSGTKDSIIAVTSDNDRFVALTYYGTLLTSLDGNAWIPQSSVPSSNLSGITYGAASFVAVGYEGQILHSSVIPSDSIPPTIIFSNISQGSFNQTSGTITFTANENATFKCSLDSGTYAACTSPYSYSSLTNGQHTLSVIATDGAGNVSMPTTYTWTINTSNSGSVSGTQVPVMEGIWLLPGVVAGLGLFARRRKG